MPTDSRRVNGPENTLQYQLYTKQKKTFLECEKELLHSSTRKDGRKPADSRRMCKLTRHVSIGPYPFSIQGHGLVRQFLVNFPINQSHSFVSVPHVKTLAFLLPALIHIGNQPEPGSQQGFNRMFWFYSDPWGHSADSGWGQEVLALRHQVMPK